jgi:hypothetical protein
MFDVGSMIGSAIIFGIGVPVLAWGLWGLRHRAARFGAGLISASMIGAAIDMLAGTSAVVQIAITAWVTAFGVVMLIRGSRENP